MGRRHDCSDSVILRPWYRGHRSRDSIQCPVVTLGLTLATTRNIQGTSRLDGGKTVLIPWFLDPTSWYRGHGSRDSTQSPVATLSLILFSTRVIQGTSRVGWRHDCADSVVVIPRSQVAWIYSVQLPLPSSGSLFRHSCSLDSSGAYLSYSHFVNLVCCNSGIYMEVVRDILAVA